MDALRAEIARQLGLRVEEWCVECIGVTAAAERATVIATQVMVDYGWEPGDG